MFSPVAISLAPVALIRLVFVADNFISDNALTISGLD